MSWREYFGMSAELERIQPGHTRGVAIFYAVAGACFAALAWGMISGGAQ